MNLHFIYFGGFGFSFYLALSCMPGSWYSEACGWCIMGSRMAPPVGDKLLWIAAARCVTPQ
jgi:hypothetical protein